MSPFGMAWSGSRSSLFRAESHLRQSLAVLLAFALAVSVVFFAAPSPVSAAGETVKFAAFGDYGHSVEANEQLVADIVDAKGVDLIVTTGDNSYGEPTLDGTAVSIIDYNIGKSYSDYIGGYIGGYGSTATTNRFFPSPGNHDFTDGDGIAAYQAYFTLPGAGVASSGTSGSELYYDFIEGPVHFFAIDSHSAASTTSLDTQKTWLEAQLAASTSQWNVVYFHHPAFSSGEDHGSTAYMQWPFEDWGADAVLAGHDHVYERILLDENTDGTDMVYLTTGAGGKSLYDFTTPVEGSVVRYNAAYGTVIATASDTELTFEFFSIADGGASAVDSYTLDAPPASPEWVAFNDMYLGAATSTHPNATAYTYGTSSSGDGTSGLLKDFADGSPLPVTVTGSFDVPVEGTGYDPHNSGSDADTDSDADSVFGGIIDLNGSIELDETDWSNTVTFTGLDDSKTYAITLTANRYEASASTPGYPGERYTKVSIDGVAVATPEPSPGVVDNLDGTYSFSVGDNRAGYVVKWVGIEPIGGSFSVTSEWDEGQGSQPPGGTTLDPNANTKGYSMSAFKLEQYAATGPSAPPVAPVLAVDVVDATSLDVSWGSVANAESYELRVDSGTPFAATSPYSAMGLTTGTEYCYGVRAMNATDGDSDWSSQVCATPAYEVQSQVAQGSDDAEEHLELWNSEPIGTVDVGSSDLEFVYDTPPNSNYYEGNQLVGMRFPDLAVPQGATILSAHVEFFADLPTGPAELVFYGEDADSASTFAETLNNISARPSTTATVPWSTGTWSDDVVYASADLSAIVQEIVNRGGWVSGNALALMVEGTPGDRVRAESADGSGGPAPKLVIEFDSDAPPVAPVLAVDIVDATSVDVSWDPVINAESYELRVDSGTPFAATSPYSATGLTTGTEYCYEVRAMNASDGDSDWSAEVCATPAFQVQSRVSLDSDDAEEDDDDGAMSLTSSDLEMVEETELQLVGVRFQSVEVPPGATILGAHIEFVADEAHSGATSLTIAGQAADNPATFASTASNISSRIQTAEVVPWVPDAWAVGEVHQTPDLSQVVQEIVDRGGWSMGNSMAFVVEGSGKRVAVSYDADPPFTEADAPLLVVDYLPLPPPDEWVAFNDMNTATNPDVDPNPANVTSYTYATSGPLVDYASGAVLPVTVTGTGDYDPHPSGGPADAGTPADWAFGGIVNLDGTDELGAGDENTVTFEGLDPSKRYAITLSANRYGDDLAGYPDERYAKVTIGGAIASEYASSDGVVKNSETSVSFSVGDNRQGLIAKWVDIQPSAEGSFSVTSEWDDVFAGSKGYSMSAFKLETYNPPPEDWTAYNDTGFPSGDVPDTDITTFTSPNGGSGHRRSGELVDYATGYGTGAFLTITGGSYNGGSQSDHGTSLTVGDAAAVFNGFVDLSGSVSYVDDGPDDDLVFEFDGLDPAKRYTVVHYANRENGYGWDRAALATISGVDGFSNTSTQGLDNNAEQVFDDVDDPSTRYSADNSTGTDTPEGDGWIVRFEDIEPGPDGAFTLTMSWDGDGTALYTGKYSNAIQLATQPAPPPTPASVVLSGDNVMDVFVNGELVGSSSTWMTATSFATDLAPGDVVGVHVEDLDWSGGLLAEIDWDGSTFVSDTSWQVTTSTPGSGWNDRGFDDSGWVDATSYGSWGVAPWLDWMSGFPLPTDAQWIWSDQNDNTGDDDVYFRWVAGTPSTADDTIVASADNMMDVYVNGVLVGSSSTWMEAQTFFDDLSDDDVIGVHATDNPGAFGFGGFMAQVDWDGNTTVSDTSWKVTTSTPASDWADQGFNDSGWDDATAYGPFGVSPWMDWMSGFPSGSDAQWIWSDDNIGDDDVYFRKVLGSPDASLDSIVASADNTMDVYVNGELLASSTAWMSATSVFTDLSAGDVVAVYATDLDVGGLVGGFIAQVDWDGMTSVSDAGWKVTTSAPAAGWNDNQGFDESGWVAASVYGAFGDEPWMNWMSGFPDPTSAQWIWSGDNEVDNNIWLRYTLPAGP